MTKPLILLRLADTETYATPEIRRVLNWVARLTGRVWVVYRDEYGKRHLRFAKLSR